tara:strand:- start:1982 stop:2200 length:219 start_codon:yes stop_codon:yes gene_type:complete
MTFYKIANTHTERKQVREFWQDMHRRAEKIYNEYTDDKEDKFHKTFYKRIIYSKDDLKGRPDFFEPIYTSNK